MSYISLKLQFLLFYKLILTSCLGQNAKNKEEFRLLDGKSYAFGEIGLAYSPSPLSMVLRKVEQKKDDEATPRYQVDIVSEQIGGAETFTPGLFFAGVHPADSQRSIAFQHHLCFEENWTITGLRVDVFINLLVDDPEGYLSCHSDTKRKIGYAHFSQMAKVQAITLNDVNLGLAAIVSGVGKGGFALYQIPVKPQDNPGPECKSFNPGSVTQKGLTPNLGGHGLHMLSASSERDDKPRPFTRWIEDLQRNQKAQLKCGFKPASSCMILGKDCPEKRSIKSNNPRLLPLNQSVTLRTQKNTKSFQLGVNLSHEKSPEEACRNLQLVARQANEKVNYACRFLNKEVATLEGKRVCLITLDVSLVSTFSEQICRVEGHFIDSNSRLMATIIHDID